MKKLLNIGVFCALLILIIFCACAKKNNEPVIEPIEYTVQFIIDDEPFMAYTVKSGETVQQPEIKNKDGYILKGWYLSQQYTDKWDFADSVTENLYLYGFWVNQDENFYTIIYKDGDYIIESLSVPEGDFAYEILPTSKAGYNFIGWSSDGKMFDFSTPLHEDLTLTAVWKAIEYSVTFIADEQIVATRSYTIENQEIDCPSVPLKEYFNGEWEIFELNFQNIVVNAVYSPIIYTATFLVDNAVYASIDYTVLDSVILPEIPSKDGYLGEWNGLPVSGGNITVTAEYTPIIYTVTFMANGVTVQQSEYTIENKDYAIPDVPPRTGYVGQWEDLQFDTGNVIINAEYTIINFKAEFIADGNVIATSYFNIENMDITEPAIQGKAGYTAEWSPYSLELNDIKIYAIYTPIVYYAVFVAENQQIAKLAYTVENTQIAEPVCPTKVGYNCSWERYNPLIGGITVNALYTPITYTISFIADGIIVGTSTYDIENLSIQEPAVPQKEGYNGKWQNYSLNLQNVYVYAEYTLIETPSDIEDDSSDITEFVYSLNADGTYSIDEYKGNKTEITIPSVYNGLPVTIVSDYAFFNSEIESVTISNGITEIGKSAFENCIKLRTVIIAETVKTIHELAFYNCASLESIVIPENVTLIEINAFGECNSLASATFINTSGWYISQTASSPPLRYIDPYDFDDRTFTAFRLLNWNMYCWING